MAWKGLITRYIILQSLKRHAMATTFGGKIGEIGDIALFVMLAFRKEL